MKILHVSETVMGGVGTHIVELVPFQRKTWGKQQIALLIPFEHKAHLQALGDCNLMTFPHPNRIRGVVNLVFAYWRAMRVFAPDVVHTHSTFAGAVASLLRPFFPKTPLIYCPHGWAMEMDQSALRRKAIGVIEFLLCIFCDKIIAVSSREKEIGCGIGVPARKIAVVLNGIEPTPPQVTPVPWVDDRLRILFVGRFDRQKGIDILLSAIKGLETRVSLRVVGARVVDESPFEVSDYTHISFLGWQTLDQVAAQMMSCDVLVMPSRWEGLPIVALEAMRLRKPVIAASVGGLPEVIEDGKTGVLFPKNDVEALRKILISVDRGKLVAMGEAGYQRFLNLFTAEKMAKSIQNVAEGVLG